MDQQNGASQPNQQPQGNQQPIPGSDEYNQMMADKFRQGHGSDESGVEQPPVSPMPEGGYEKFYNKETGEYNWQAHAQELQYRLDQSSNKSNDKQQGEQPKDEDSKDGDAEDDDIYSRAGLDPTELEQQIIQKGTLDAEAKEALVKVGVPEALIDMFVQSYARDVQHQRQAIIQDAGGEQSWNQIAKFVQTLPQEEQDAFYEGLGGKYRKYVLQDIKERMKTAGPLSGEKPMITGDALSSGVVGYRSRAEMKRDMADPRYNKDPAYRQQVMQKVHAATWDLDRY